MGCFADLAHNYESDTLNNAQKHSPRAFINEKKKTIKIRPAIETKIKFDLRVFLRSSKRTKSEFHCAHTANHCRWIDFHKISPNAACAAQFLRASLCDGGGDGGGRKMLDDHYYNCWSTVGLHFRAYTTR